ncbi:MAG: polyribonucleotide nucleotidyltransferase [Planctomycetota bacterium]|jgi:polyribonucleotide nucleotidyltransferase
MPYVKKERSIGGATLSIETGKMGKLASGSVVVRLGDTMVFVAAVDGPVRPGLGFFPMTMDYREKTSSAGKIPGGFFKREGRPTEKEILTMRMMDRPIRPLFEKGYLADVQIQAQVISSDVENDGDVLAMNGASAALTLSDIPFLGPLGAVRVGHKDGEFMINPTLAQRAESDLDLIVGGTAEAVTMVEAAANEVSEETMLAAIAAGHEVVKELCAMQVELREEAGDEKQSVTAPTVDEELKDKIEKAYYDKIFETQMTLGKLQNQRAMRVVRDACVEEFTDADSDADHVKRVKEYYDAAAKKAFRDQTLTGTRTDGRKGDEIRQIDTEVGFLPRAHGSSLFTRGETQALVTCTLGTSLDEQIVDGLGETTRNRFMLHYNFPAFSVREVKPIRGPGRREIGHGNLAHRAIAPVLPDHDDFPYTLRIVADILESNGSSSMATVCGGIQSMMDAGVPVKQPVAGVAMGLVTDGERTVILSDIAGKEDAWGDMDFKVAGTHQGITALQMDIKITGLKPEIMAAALEQAKAGRVHILRRMLDTLAKPREDTSEYAPRSHKVKIPVDKIGALIGPGGKNIRALQEDTGAKIAVEDDGSVTIYATSPEGMERAKAQIDGMAAVPEVGRDYEGKVVSIKDFGCFVEFLPTQEGLVHVSELSDQYVDDPTKEVNVGDVIKVKVVGFEERSGKVRLSRKAILMEEKGLEYKADEGPKRGGGRGGDRGGRGGDRGRGRGGDRGRGRGGDRGGRGGDRS